ncbi:MULTISPECIES: TetR/AcrR family transcriptional regulator [unclassified Streptomyces]|uniref:TetR/AcrR family transcriptional regulator n=1 Tax=unclassified Streptomyces TaxID=2593676 RepID=UPI000DBA328D|nr:MULTISPECIES: TetR/AcrR family transcriptional regulator [unclassified Streptomyces]MYT73559.1 TetR family transcriptional regulator [Streptomyces sp. SID8367]RAJ85096.1 TetR family transcriptional regulator [Streptomyces sp. PsTaAH-137]
MADRTSGEQQIDGRSTRWDEHKAQRQVELVDAAVALIEEEGARFRVQRLAERVGQSRSVLYRHFKDRATLDELIRRRVVESFMRGMEPTLTFEGTIEESVERVVGAHLDWVSQHPRLYAYMGVGDHAMGDGSLVADTKTAIALMLSERFGDVVKALGVPQAPIRSVAVGIVGFVDTAVNQWVRDPEREVSEEELRAMLCRSVWAVLEATLRDLGVELSPQQRVADLEGA